MDGVSGIVYMYIIIIVNKDNNYEQYLTLEMGMAQVRKGGEVKGEGRRGWGRRGRVEGEGRGNSQSNKQY